jgi:hypothetical protein
LVLGFVQQHAKAVTIKPDTDEESKKADAVFPTPWNHIEAGIMFACRLPVLVFREEGISGGVFDPGVSDVFVHKMPTIREVNADEPKFRDVVLKWQAEVRTNYYSD